MPDALRLEVTDFKDLARWRWVLKDATGAFLADHEVRLDPVAERFEAFTALQDYVSWHAAPDRRTYEEARIVRSVGDWAASKVFGDAIASALTARCPATVEVILPACAEVLAFLPLETTRIQGKSFAAHGISLIIRPPVTPSGGTSQARAGGRLRILGLFSLPEGGNALNLRRERTELVKIFRSIAASGRDADVRVLQYGVTRDRLRGILQDAEGWDIVHISGHGAAGHLILETADGHPDPINVGDLADLLDAASDRVKLVVLSACWSAALATADQRRLLRLPIPENQEQFYPRRPGPTPSDQSPVGGALATELAGRLSCAVLAMRFPVADEFAVALSAKLYDLLAREGQPLPRAIALTLQHLAEGIEGWPFPALSMAAPAILGATAASLTLQAPARTGSRPDEAENRKMAGFPPQADHFVGRTAVMARASKALAAGSGVSGVLLHGMPGGGKTACALELAYTHEDAFQKLIWYKAPDQGMDVVAALTDFALTLEQRVNGIQMIDKVVSDVALTKFLPMLTELMERNRLLIIIDNAEFLLTDSGQWRDARWGKVIAGLMAHAGLGRVILTSQRIPARTLNVQVEAVEALTADEALLLARELPNLRRLIGGKLDGIDQSTASSLALRVLDVAQGHPKLLELADRQAAHPEQLSELLQAGGHAWRDQGGLPEGFFATGETTAAPGDYLHILAAWTRAVADTLSEDERALFWFLCCLEEPDRISPVLAGIVAKPWLGQDGQPLNVEQALAAITFRGLAAIHSIGTKYESESYIVHPGVATAGRDQAGKDFLASSDTAAANFWFKTYKHAMGDNEGHRVYAVVAVRAGLAVIPYLLRQDHWDRAAVMAETVFNLDPSRASAAAILPVIQRIAARHPRHSGKLASVLRVLDPAAETQIHAAIDEAAACGDHEAAAATTGRLANLYMDSGRLSEALKLADQTADYSTAAELGPWTQLGEEVRRLQILIRMGEARQVLDKVRQLRVRTDTLPAMPGIGHGEAVQPWDVREVLLDTGRSAAVQLGCWQEALHFGAEIAASQRARLAPDTDIACTLLNVSGPLLELGRADEALALLLDCRRVFYHARDFRSLGRVLTALAVNEDQRRHGESAIRMQRDALRYGYLTTDILGIEMSYHNLGFYLHCHDYQPYAVPAARLAAALIRALTGIDGIGNGAAARSAPLAMFGLYEFGVAAPFPADIANLCRRISDIPGTDLPGLIARLSPDPQTAERTLRDLIERELEEGTWGEWGWLQDI